jgi:cytoskeletal protein CcmA (bactofilin family)
MHEHSVLAIVPQSDDEVAEFSWDDFLPSKLAANAKAFSVIDEFTSITGKYITKNAFIHGSVDGLVFAEDVVIEKTGHVSGFIFCRTLNIQGHVHANVICDSVVVREGAVLQTNLKYKSLKIMPGGKVTGSLESRNVKRGEAGIIEPVDSSLGRLRR